MNLETIFTAANTLAMIAWLFLLILPRWKWTQRIIIGGGISLIFCAAYLVLMILHWGGSEGGFGSLAGVMQLFTDPAAVLIGWLHYLAFDLFIGCWETVDAQRKGIRHLYIIPCLLLTFLVGPIGLLVYFIVRGLYTKDWMLIQT